jgi:hypothetical protein
MTSKSIAILLFLNLSQDKEDEYFSDGTTEEISLFVANKIRENFGHIDLEVSLEKEKVKSVEAYDYYLRGRHFQLKWTNDALKKAIEHYKKAIHLDPEHSRHIMELHSATFT